MQALENEFSPGYKPCGYSGYKHLHICIEEYFTRNAAARCCVEPNVFDISEDGSCITDVRETDMITRILGALLYIYMKAQDEEQTLHPGRPTMAASLELVQKVLELNIQNSKTPGLKTYSPSEMEPIFEQIVNFIDVEVNLALAQNPASYARPQDYDSLNECLLENIVKVLDKVALIVKNIYLSRAVDRGAVPTDAQRIMEEYRAIFGRMTMSIERYAMCARVCGQCPDEDICGNMLTPYDQKKEDVTLKLLGCVIEVYTPQLIQDMKAEMKSNKKAAEVQTKRQVMREQRTQKVAAEKVAKEETEAAVGTEAEREHLAHKHQADAGARKKQKRENANGTE
jgi:hypothetical protein